MRRYLVKRLLSLIPVLWGVSTFVFLIIHLIPGDPVDLMLGETAEPADKAALRSTLGLDKPLGLQYALFLGNLARGDVGRSLHTKRPVLKTIAERLPATAELAVASLLLAILIALPLGVCAAIRQYSWVDLGSMGFALLGVSIPHFWLGPLLILVFSVALDWLPVSGREGWAHLVLPTLTLGTALASILARMTRASMLEVIRMDYVTVARAKGLRERVVIGRHALKNALIPLITLLGLQMGALLSGAIITETVFAWPGIGRLTVQAIHGRDYPLVQGCVLVIATVYVCMNFLTDLAYAWADPRIKYE
ncbi:MAG: ABC transporter permease [Nitrospinae bacterium]|nr:ABC transporter permease [Nitrospinota bacterium]